MNRFKIVGIWVLAAAVAFATVACTDSGEEPSDKKQAPGQKTTVQLKFTLAPTSTATINNVWILQWDAAGNNKVCYKERYHDMSTLLEATLTSGNDMKVAVVAGVDAGTVFPLGINYETFCKKTYPSRITSDAEVPYSGLQQVSITKQGQQIDLSLHWIAAKVSFQIASSTAGYDLTTAQLKNVITQLPILPAAGATPTFSTGDVLLSEFDKTYTYYVGENLQGNEAGITSEKDRITTKKATYLEVVGTKIANNKRITATFMSFYGNNDTNNFDINGGNNYAQTLNIDFDAAGDKRLSKIEADAKQNLAAPANSYLLSPTEVVPLAIPVSRVNEFWMGYGNPRNAIDNGVNGGGVKKWVAKIIWETTPGLISFDTANGTAANGYIIIKPSGSNASGNVLIGIYDATVSDQINVATAKALWSWHIWVTPYNPGGDTNGIIPTISGDPGRAAVPNGYVHYFSSLAANQTADGSQVVMMDRDLGALASDPKSLLNSTGLYYQWGRKDPFYAIRPDDSAIPAAGYEIIQSVPNATDHITKELGPISLSKAVQSPTLFVISEAVPAVETGYDWLQPDNGNDFLWKNATNPAKKTLYDPCPAGWRVPADPKTFESLVPRKVWEPSSFNPLDFEANKAAGIIDEDGYYNKYPRQGVVCWDNSIQFFSNSSGRINPQNGNLFAYGSGQSLYMGTAVSKKFAYSLYQHILMGVNVKEGSMNLIEPSDISSRPSGCPVRCVKE